jgi:phosphatidylglycerol:prolipoprotein diacylglycerol transferase
MLEFYQSIFSSIDPVVFSIGSFSVRWYGLMYLVGFLTVVSLLRWRICKKETSFEWSTILDFLVYSFLGALAGGRIGYILFYNLNYFIKNPVEAFLPFQNTNSGFEITGFYGMSYFGAVIGLALTAYWFAKKRNLDLLRLLDFVVVAIPAGYFSGRIGNFINGELYGRATKSIIGINFGDGILRHPSQLYEAFFEGLVLFAILWIMRNKFQHKKGFLTGMYLVGYGVVRFLIEFFREPDSHIGFVLEGFTLGQVFALLFVVVGIGFTFGLFGKK